MENKVYRFAQNYIAPAVKKYSRLQVVGAENLPPIGKGALLACNHSGSFWWDALCLVSALSERQIHFIAHHWDAKVSLLRKPLDIIECSFLDECEDHIDDHCEVVNQLKAGKQMCIYPEESYHSFRQRYTLFQFSPHVIRYADKANVPIVPITIIGAEESAPTLIGLKKESVPLHIPFHLPLILPFKVTIDIGKPIYPDDLALSSDSQKSYTAAAEQLRMKMHESMSHYRKCKLSDEKYIERKAWF